MPVLRKSFLLVSVSLFSLALLFFAWKQFLAPRFLAKQTNAKRINFIIHLSNAQDELVASVLGDFFPKEKKLGLFFINPMVAFGEEEESLLEKKSDAPSIVEKEIQKALGISIQYRWALPTKDLERWINLLGGLDLFLDPKHAIQSKRYNRTEDHYVMDGQDVVDFMEYLPEKSPLAYIQRMDRIESVYLTLYDHLSQEKDSFPKAWLGVLHGLGSHNLTTKDLESCLEFQRKERIHFGVAELPVEPVLKSGKKEEILRSRPETAKALYQSFLNELRSPYFADRDRARIEVLNGTDRNGLAKYGKSLLNDKRLKVLSVSNAWKSNFSKSMILNRSGNTHYTEMISEIFQGRKVYHVLRKDLGLDATLILGEDFQGNR